MSQLNVNVVAPLGYTGPDLPGDSNFVEIIDKNGNTAMEITETETTVVGPLKVDSVLPNTGTVVDVNGVDVSSTGADNINIGTNSNQANTTGYENISMGTQTLENASTSYRCIAIGHQAMQASTWSQSDLAIGWQSLNAIDSSYNNCAVGNFTMPYLTTGTFNTALGGGAGEQITSGNYNTFVGSSSGLQFMTGGGNNNTTLGVSNGNTLGGSPIGNNNVFLGAHACNGYSGGDNNVYVGAYDTTAPFYVAQSGSNNVLIGKNALKATPSASNSITLGNSSHTVIRAAVTTITSLSDERDKKEIQELPVGLEFVEKLKPVKFVWNDRDEEGKHDVEDFGFIAQDLKAAQEESKAGYLNLVYDENPEKLEASYGKLLPVLVKAIQEMSSEIKSLKEEILTLKTK